MNALEGNKCYVRSVSYIIGPGEKLRNVIGQAVKTPSDLIGQHISMKRVHAKNGIWIIRGGTRKITVCSSTFYGVAAKITV